MQNIESRGCKEGGRGGGGSRNSGGGPGHSQSAAAASITSHIVASSGLGGLLEIAAAISIDSFYLWRQTEDNNYIISSVFCCSYITKGVFATNALSRTSHDPR